MYAYEREKASPSRRQKGGKSGRVKEREKERKRKEKKEGRNVDRDGCGSCAGLQCDIRRHTHSPPPVLSSQHAEF